jgi:hypothetical protein
MIQRASLETLVANLEFFQGMATTNSTHGIIGKIVGDAVQVHLTERTILRTALGKPSIGNCAPCAVGDLPASTRSGRTRVGLETDPPSLAIWALRAKLDFTPHRDAVNVAARFVADKELGPSISSRLLRRLVTTNLFFATRHHHRPRLHRSHCPVRALEFYTVPATVELLSNRLIMARRAIGRSGLFSRGCPLSRASRRRSGAVSPLMRKAGTLAP